MFAQAKYFASCRVQGVNDRSGNANGRRRASTPSGWYFELRQITSVIEACGDLLARQTRILFHDLVDGLTCGEMTQNKAHRYPGPLDPRLSSKNVGRAHDMFFPVYRHVYARSGSVYHCGPRHRARRFPDGARPRAFGTSRIRSKIFPGSRASSFSSFLESL